MTLFARRNQHFLPAATLAFSILLSTSLAISSAFAQDCPSMGSKAVVCDVAVFAALGRGRLEPVSRERAILLAAGQELTLAFEARDQYGREFPDQRMRYGLEADRSCRDLVTLEEGDGEGRYEIRAGARRGSCDLSLWVPGNLNLEWPLRIEVTGVSRDNLSHFQAERIADRLYRGILGREPDAAGLKSAVADIQRGDLERVADGMLRSEEFRENRAGLSPSKLLDSLYRGLLSRAPDSDGRRMYLDDLERRDFERVVDALLASPEFDGVLMEK